MNRYNYFIRQVLLVSFLSLVMIALNGCSDSAAVSMPVERVQAVKVVPAQAATQVVSRSFPAEVSAVKTIDLSFEVSGRLIKTNLVTGSSVKHQQVLAKIDPTPFQQREQEAQARLNQAQRDLSRIEMTAKNGLVSQSQLDEAKTQFELSKIALERAQQDLSYTTLLAPFDSQISERFAEQGNFVQAGDLIARIQDVSRYYFNVNVPERLVSQYKQGSLLSTKAHIISAPELRYDLEYVEHATQPDPITQTYKVVFAATVIDTHLTPGARATVTINLKEENPEFALRLPFTALKGNDGEGFHVWKYDQSDSQVKKVKVEVSSINNQFATIRSGITQGDLIVAAGTAKMRDGLIVKPYSTEQ